MDTYIGSAPLFATHKLNMEGRKFQGGKRPSNVMEDNTFVLVARMCGERCEPGVGQGN